MTTVERGPIGGDGGGDVLLSVSDLAIVVGPQRRRVAATRGIDFVVRDGARVGIVGESGSGKSMTILAIMGLLPPGAQVVRGHVDYRGRDVLAFGAREWRSFRGRDAGVVFQNALSALNPFVSVGAQIADAIQAHARVPRAEALSRAIDLLDTMGIPEPDLRAGAFPHQYSGGMAQRAMIALAIASDPQLVLADEPTTGLDPIVEAGVLDLLVERTRQRGQTLVMVSHDMSAILRVSTHVVVMYAGEVLEEGPLDVVMRQPRSPYTIALLESSQVRRGSEFRYIPGGARQIPTDYPGCVFSGRCQLERSLGNPEVCRTSRPVRSQLGSSHFVRCHFADTIGVTPAAADDDQLSEHISQEPGQEILGAIDLMRTYDIRAGILRRAQVPAVSDVDVSVREGEILGLIGESGSGKSTLGRILVALERPDSGTIRFEGEAITTLRHDAWRDFRRAVQMVFQSPYRSFNPMLTIGASISEACRITGRRGAALQRRVVELLALVGLDDGYAGRYPREVSGGELQRAAIARALATDPHVIFLDEPTSALDVSVRGQVVNVLLDLRRRSDLALVLVSHELDVVRALADRIAVMYGGRIVEEGPAQSVLSRPKHPYTRALIAGESSTDNGDRVDEWMAGQMEAPVSSLTSGCPYQGRCPYVVRRCREEAQILTAVHTEHAVRCWRAEEIDDASERGDLALIRSM